MAKAYVITMRGKVMVILNKNTELFHVQTERYHEMLSNHSSAKDIISGKIFQLNEGIEVPARSAMILEIK
jgi:hypothetical protein